MADLRERAPGHSLIEELLRQWAEGRIRLEHEHVVMDEEARGWFLGAQGERRVASVLAALGDDWTVLHSVPIGTRGTDIDHVLVSRFGVFTINTKHSAGKDVWVAGRGMYVGGHKQPYVLNALHEASKAAELLSRRSGLTVPVATLIVFVDAGRITRKAAAGAGEYEPMISVIRDSELLRHLPTRPVFSEEQTLRIMSAAVQSSTWSPRPLTGGSAAHITGEFTALEAALGPVMATRSTPARPAPPRSLPPRVQPPRGRTPRPRTSSRRRSRSLGPELARALVLMAVGLGVLQWYANR